MNPVWIITGKEVRDSLRNRWVLAAALLLAALALVIGFPGQLAHRYCQSRSVDRYRCQPLQPIDFPDSADCDVALL